MHSTTADMVSPVYYGITTIIAFSLLDYNHSYGVNSFRFD